MVSQGSALRRLPTEDAGMRRRSPQARDPSVIHGGRGRREARSGRADALIDDIKNWMLQMILPSGLEGC